MPGVTTNTNKSPDAQPLAVGANAAGLTVVALLIESPSKRLYRVDRGGVPLVLDVPRAPRAEALDRVHRQLRAHERLSHASIARAVEIVETSDWCGLLYDAPGEPLSTRPAPARFPDPLADAITDPILDAFAAAHARDVVHPAPSSHEVFVEGHGARATVRVIGLIEAGGQAIPADPRHLAPEQVRELVPSDASTNVFGLGVLLYELHCGRPPFSGDRLELFVAASRGDFVRPFRINATIDDAADVAIAAALEPNPSRRVPDAPTLARLYRGDTDAFVQQAALPMMLTPTVPAREAKPLLPPPDDATLSLSMPIVMLPPEPSPAPAQARSAPDTRLPQGWVLASVGVSLTLLVALGGLLWIAAQRGVFG